MVRNGEKKRGDGSRKQRNQAAAEGESKKRGKGQVALTVRRHYPEAQGGTHQTGDIVHPELRHELFAVGGDRVRTEL